MATCVACLREGVYTNTAMWYSSYHKDSNDHPTQEPEMTIITFALIALIATVLAKDVARYRKNRVAGARLAAWTNHHEVSALAADARSAAYFNAAQVRVNA